MKVKCKTIIIDFTNMYVDELDRRTSDIVEEYLDNDYNLEQIQDTITTDKTTGQRRIIFIKLDDDS